MVATDRAKAPVSLSSRIGGHPIRRPIDCPASPQFPGTVMPISPVGWCAMAGDMAAAIDKILFDKKNIPFFSLAGGAKRVYF